MKRGFRAIKAFGACALVLAAAQQALVAARLQGLLACSWVLVWSPWLLVELGLLLRAAASAPVEWAAEAPPKSLPRFAMRVFGCFLARLATAVLVAARAQELVTCSWLWCLLPPLLVAAAGACCSRAASEPSPARPPLSVDMPVQLQDIQARPELNGREARLKEYLQESGRWTVELDDGSKISLKPECLQPLESAEDELPGKPSVGRVLCWLPWLALAALKLDGHGLSAFLVFLPVFAAVCCTTCFFSCSFLCITAEMVEESFAAQEEQAGQPGPAEAQSHYERMA